MTKQNPTIEDDPKYIEIKTKLEEAERLLKILHYGPVSTYTWEELADWIEDNEDK